MILEESEEEKIVSFLQMFKRVGKAVKKFAHVISFKQNKPRGLDGLEEEDKEAVVFLEALLRGI